MDKVWFGLFYVAWYCGADGKIFVTDSYGVACAQGLSVSHETSHDGWEVQRIGPDGRPRDTTPLDRGEAVELSSSQAMHTILLTPEQAGK